MCTLDWCETSCDRELFRYLCEMPAQNGGEILARVEETARARDSGDLRSPLTEFVPALRNGVRGRKVSKDLAAPQGFEPRYADPESAVLAVERGGSSGFEPSSAHAAHCQRLKLILWFDECVGQQNCRARR